MIEQENLSGSLIVGRVVKSLADARPSNTNMKYNTYNGVYHIKSILINEPKNYPNLRLE